MKERRYLGSAPHLAFTSILIGAAFWHLYLSLDAQEINLLGISSVVVFFGLLLAYGYKCVFNNTSSEPFRLNTPMLSLVIMNMVLLGLMLPKMLVIMLNLSQQTSFAELKVIVNYIGSILLGIQALLSAPKGKPKQRVA